MTKKHTISMLVLLCLSGFGLLPVSTVAEFQNGQFGIILRDPDGNPSKEVPPCKECRPPQTPIGGTENISVSSPTPHVQLGQQAHGLVTKGADVGFLNMTGSAEVRIGEGAKVTHV